MNYTAPTYETTTALHVAANDRVLIGSEYRTAHSVHYSGPISGDGTTTICHSGGEWSGPSSTPIRRQLERTALIVGNGITADRVSAYLPRGYRVVEADITGRQGDSVIIAGHDVAGWTLEDYVLPRLASGGLYGTAPAYGIPTQR